MFEIDGSQKSGSGTILRLAVAFAAIRSQSLHIFNIRQNRPQRGLRPQHLEAVLTAAKLCGAELEGAKLGSEELWFKPNQIRGGEFKAEIGTAGNIPMLLLTVLPMCLFADETVTLKVVKGGTDTSNAPTVNYLRYLLLPRLKQMGVNSELTIHKYGYYPKGMGEVTLSVQPAPILAPVRLNEFGLLRSVHGTSVCTFLADRKVAERQAKAAKVFLLQRGISADVQIVNDQSNPFQKGSSIVLWAETDTGAVLGADAIGELGKTSEAVGLRAAEKLYAELSAKPTVDRYMADMLVPYVALARGTSSYWVREVTDHLEANMWLGEKMLEARFNVKKTGTLFNVQKVS